MPSKMIIGKIFEENSLREENEVKEWKKITFVSGFPEMTLLDILGDWLERFVRFDPFLDL